MTTLVAISDTHGRHRSVDVPDGDILVHAGDFSSFGSEDDLEDFNSWLGSLPHAEKIVVAGNCDHICETSPAEVRALLTEAHYLQDSAVEIAGLKFWGSPWQPIFHHMAFNLPRGEALAEKWAMIPADTDVLVTHGPPHGILDRTSRGQQVGDRALLARVTEVKPTCHIFGHVHESSGMVEQQGTCFINAACNAAGDRPFVYEL
ncbi:metallophosphoesterase [Persicimonas caeni]|uniref:Metallophosphoesterase n=1 Tax=Persicimonas caeni TaxID=2292766 RepID=A0A4Y6PLR5_PERCE|nr:metallophosphatase domain-containing protein [Persicimonas caeni]QDG49190.1 metallophosphoesterase [Persicimonas caeni]QED30411.1 metallophosphoesterase [Persicimonas caeni]